MTIRRKITLAIIAGVIVLAGGFLIWGVKSGKIKTRADVAGVGVAHNYPVDPKAEFVPGELIVKYKSPAKATSKSIGGLNQKYGATEQKELTPGQAKTDNPLKGVYKIKLTKKPVSAKKDKFEKEEVGDATSLTEAQDQNTRVKAEMNSEAKAKQEIKTKERTPDEINTLQALEEYRQNPDILYAEPNYIMKANMVPNDPYYSSSNSWGQGYDDLWGLKKINTSQAWDTSQGDGVIAAVIDTGVDYNHEDIADNILKNPNLPQCPTTTSSPYTLPYTPPYTLPSTCTTNGVFGYDFANNDPDPMDDAGHGTHVAGTIAGVGNNNKGVIGVAPKAKIMAVKGLDKDGYGYTNDLAKALIYAADNRAKIINCSWGGAGHSQLIEDAINYAHNDKKVTIIVAAGNSNNDANYYSPANISNVITVSSINHYGYKSSFSNWGEKIDVAAPGGDSGSDPKAVNILSLRANNTDMYGDGKNIVGDKYYRARGTSMASPHVAGLAALILAKNPQYNPEQVRKIIRQSAQDIETPGWDVYSGYGLINAEAALKQNINQFTDAEIIEPKYREDVGFTEIKGTADADDFSNYKIEIGQFTETEETWTTKGIKLTQPNQRIRNGVLATLNPKESGIKSMGTIKLTVNGTGKKREAQKPVYTDLSYHQGWPKTIGPESTVVSSPLYADLNKDGVNEIIIQSNEDWGYAETSKLIVLKIDGTILWQREMDGRVRGTIPAIGDINKDGKLEIVSVTTGKSTSCWQPSTGKVYVWQANGSLAGGNWPLDLFSQGEYFSGSYCWQQPIPALADLNKDGYLEILIASGTRLFNISYQGKVTKSKDIQPIYNPGGASSSGIIAVGDVNNDGRQEIVVNGYHWKGGEISIPESEAAVRGFIYVFGDNLEILYKNDNLYQNIDFLNVTAPALADLNNDGKLEIVYTYGIQTVLERWPDGNPKSYYNEFWVAAIDATGKNIFSPVNVGRYGLGVGLTPAIGDVNGDGSPEIAVSMDATNKDVTLLNNKGQILWQKDISSWMGDQSPILANVDNSTSPEIVIGGLTYYYQIDYARFNILDKNGQNLGDLSKSVHRSYVTTAAVGDFDKDGKTEIFGGTGGGTGLKLFMWDMDSTWQPANSPWPMVRHDPQNTGAYTKPQAPPPPITTTTTTTTTRPTTTTTTIPKKFTMQFINNSTQVKFTWTKDGAQRIAISPDQSYSNFQYIELNDAARKNKTVTVSASGKVWKAGGCGGCKKCLTFDLNPKTKYYFKTQTYNLRLFLVTLEEAVYNP